MRKIVAVVFVALALAGCKEELPGSVSEACEVAWRIFYRDTGRFTLTAAEYDALEPPNQSKVARFKYWFKTECPDQYARTVGGKKK